MPIQGQFQLAQQLEEAFESIGCSMMSDDFACQLLAFTYVCGSELCVLHGGLNAGIAIASQKLNIKGGEMPNPELVPKLQGYIKQLEKEATYTPWLKDIYHRYQIKDKDQCPAYMFTGHGKGSSTANKQT